MAIQITIVGAAIQNNELVVTVDTTNDTRPGDTRRLDAAFPTTMSALEIKAQIDQAIQLLWVALSNPSWEL